MERQLWRLILQLLDAHYNPRGEGRYQYSSREIVEVWMWCVIHDRPVSWACEPTNWPAAHRRCEIPSNTTMSRRLRSPAVQELLKKIETEVFGSEELSGLVWLIDGKPLPIGGCSKDRQAGYGRAAGGKAKGYKLHAIIGKNNVLAEWRVAPMNKDERVMAQRMLLSGKFYGYVVGDKNYDSNKLHKVCDEKENLQMVVPRRYGKHRGLGHRKQTTGRLRSKDILEDPFPKFGRTLLKIRNDIERYFGNLTNWGGGLACLPSWVRTHHRVHRWVQAKLILTTLKTKAKITTYGV